MQPDDVKKYTEFWEKSSRDKDASISRILELLSKNIDHLRTFCSNLLTINVTVIGAALAGVLSHPEFILKPNFLIFGLAILTLNSILIIFYSSYVLVNENEVLSKRHDFLVSTFDEVQQLALKNAQQSKSYELFNKEYEDKLKDFATKEENQIIQDKKTAMSAVWLYLLSAIFIVGLITLILGVVPMSKSLIKNYSNFESEVCIQVESVK